MPHQAKGEHKLWTMPKAMYKVACQGLREPPALIPFSWGPYVAAAAAAQQAQQAARAQHTAAAAAATAAATAAPAAADGLGALGGSGAVDSAEQLQKRIRCNLTHHRCLQRSVSPDRSDPDN